MMPKGWKTVIEEKYPEVVAEIGSDVVIAVADTAPSNGTSGTLVGVAGKGSLLIDFVNGKLYQNTGTKSNPTWTAFTVNS